MVDTRATLSTPVQPTFVNVPNFNGSTTNFTLTGLINKDNIFQQPAEILQKLCVPQNKEELKKKDMNTETVNVQETQKLNSFLNSLGLKLNSIPFEPMNNPPATLQPLELVVRAKEGIYLVNNEEKEYINDKSKLICENATVTLFNTTGSLLAFANQQAIGVYILAKKKTMIYDLPNVIALDFSPGQRYLVTIDRRENRFFISIFEADPLRKLFEFETCRYQKETWPQLKFTQNDELAFWASKSTQIEVFNPRQNFQIIKTIETKPFDFFNISVKMDNLLIVCVGLEHSAGYNGHEGRIDIYKYQDLENDHTPMVSKIIDKAHEVQLFFSPTGQNLLIWAQTFTDKTGQSYYGEHILFYLDMNKKALKRVPTYKGPIHDVAWNPNGLEFIVISGFMPAGSVLFDNFCVPKFEFGRHHRNSIKWSPFSRFVCLAGFGNLPGDMEIWDAYSLKQVGSCKSSSAVSCKWAPDGRRIITGVLNPRLRVSNNYKVFKYTGELLNHVDFSQSELYEVLWRPGKYHDRPASPPRQVMNSENMNNGTDQAEKPSEKPIPEKKLFRPKGAGTFAAQLKAEKSAKTGGRFLTPDEMFGNESNIEGQDGKQAELSEKSSDSDKEKEDRKPRITTKLLRRNDKKEENSDKEKESPIDKTEQKSA